MLVGEHELRVRKTRRQVAEAGDGRRLPRARGTGELVGLLAKLFEVQDDLLPVGRRPRRRGGC